MPNQPHCRCNTHQRHRIIRQSLPTHRHQTMKTLRDQILEHFMFGELFFDTDQEDPINLQKVLHELEQGIIPKNEQDEDLIYYTTPCCANSRSINDADEAQQLFKHINENVDYWMKFIDSQNSTTNDFDPAECWTPDEAALAAIKQPDPLEAAIDIIRHNMEISEYGWACVFIQEYQINIEQPES